jgi:hypothetical protein
MDYWIGRTRRPPVTKLSERTETAPNFPQCAGVVPPSGRIPRGVPVPRHSNARRAEEVISDLRPAEGAAPGDAAPYTHPHISTDGMPVRMAGPVAPIANRLYRRPALPPMRLLWWSVSRFILENGLRTGLRAFATQPNSPSILCPPARRLRLVFFPSISIAWPILAARAAGRFASPIHFRYSR